MRLSTLWTIIIALTIFSCKTQKLQPKISTDKKDTRILMLTGQWYIKPQKEESSTFNFTKQKNDSADLKIKFNLNGKFILENRTNKTNPTKEGLWFLVGDKLYIETYVSGKCNVYAIKNISDTLLSYTYYKTKNIYEPFLCGDEQTYSFTEVPAKYGTKNKDFENYFTTNLKLSEQAKTVDADCIVEFAINCNGEVCEVLQFPDKKTEFEKAIVTLLRQMPKWTPATMKGKAINFKKKYKFTYQSGQLKIRE